MILCTFAIVALGVGFGAIYPNFKYENIAQVATSFGGLMYMISCVIFMSVIIILEARPVYIIFMSDLRGSTIMTLHWAQIVISFILVLLIIGFAVYKPMKMGLEAIKRYE